MKSIIDMLYASEAKFAYKPFLKEVDKEISYHDFLMETKAIASCLCHHVKGQKQPVVIMIDKSIAALSSMMATLMSSNFYTILDVKMPLDRIELILETLQAKVLICDEKQFLNASKLAFDGEILVYEKIKMEAIDDQILNQVEKRLIDTDPAYVLFTSGSTGVPKGTVVSHRSVLAYAQWVCEAFHINNQTIFGNQTPFYFSMSVLDIFATIKAGATLCIIPKLYFSFPAKLLTFMNEAKVNTIYWVPSALGIISNLNALDAILPNNVDKVLFAGEVMPTKVLNYWKTYLPNAMYANLYGPTEVTDICTYYIVNREFSNDEPLPIGNACNNCDVFVLNEKDELVSDDEAGELCVRGSFLAHGYYDQEAKTKEVFVLNPLQKHYPEYMYRSGDIVKYNEYGELMYLSRKDFQIKHMGYRIELGEIETNVFSIEDVLSCACIYDQEKRHIVLFYQSKTLEDKDLLTLLKGKVPAYMLPNKMMKMKRMPYNANGKIDRKELKKRYMEEMKNGKIN